MKLDGNLSRVVILGSVVFASFSLASAQDWPQWRGQHRDGHAADFKVPATWPADIQSKWKIKIGEGAASPAVVGDHVYTFSREGTYEVTRCVDAKTGKEAWQDKYETLPATGPAGRHPGPRSSPTVADGKVITYGVRGTLSCLDATSGKVIWRKESHPDAWPRFFTSSSPIVVNRLCIAQLGSESAGSITAFDLATGDEQWKWSEDGTAYASATTATVDGTKLIITQTAGKVVALEPATGKSVWEIPFVAQGRGYNTATPIVDGDVVIYSGSGRGTTAVKLEKDGAGFKATELWSNKDGSVQFNNPILANGLILGLNPGGELFCIDEKSGKTAWTKSLSGDSGNQGGGRRGGGGGFGSIVEAGPVFFALTPSSDLIAFDAKESGYELLGRWHVADSPTYAYPVVSGDHIYIKDQDSLALFSFN